jgi:hypothetical protein
MDLHETNHEEKHLGFIKKKTNQIAINNVSTSATKTSAASSLNKLYLIKPFQ